MREIKFRGQTRRKGERIINMAGDKCESNWVYGGIFPQNEDEKGFAIIYQQEPEIRKYPVYADTVGQYTGLKDKNSKEIYEGDILEENYKGLVCERYLVVWDSQEGSWMLKSKSGARYGIGSLNQSNFEVIGNVFDNPELMKGDKTE